jgi:hypothetical protein
MNAEFLQRKYSREDWQKFLPQLLPGVELFGQAHDFPLTNEREKTIATARRQFGTAKLTDGKRIAFYEIDVAAKVDLLRNRVALRELIARCIDEVSAHAVLAFFIQPGNTAYRLSYAAKESKLGENNLIYTEQTATRRFTYILGPGETRRTAALRLASLAEKHDTTKLADVTDAFSVEKLNIEFFNIYKQHYKKFCDHLIDDTDVPQKIFSLQLRGLDDKTRDRALKPVRDFIKKLLGRLVFLHFLQKKGWLGCPAVAKNWKNGELNFNRQLFDSAPEADRKRFHSRRLVPLFFDTLNRERKDDLFSVTGTRVPYLNGGLFERDFEGVEQIDFPSELFANLLEFFGQYNFTIDENDPDDHEIGIDPEMLGHIFENLLEDNKDKGAYYTPKAVVQYMCQQSLIHALAGNFSGNEVARTEIERFIRRKEPIDPKKDSWLAMHATAIEKILDDLNICDPAIGSGAFPIGLLQEIYWTKLTLHPALDRAEAKRTIIQRSIHGVDIDAGAVEIARLRFWLALIVEEKNPVPLPNLDYQIMQGNSLLESFEGLDLSKISEPARVGVTLLGSDQVEFGLSARSLELSVGSESQETLAKLEQKYFACHDPEKKALLRAQIDAAILRAIDAQLEHRRDELETSLKQRATFIGRRASSVAEAKKRGAMQAELDALADKKNKLHTLLENPRAERPFFLWHFWFRHILKDPPAGRGGFDIVIANPPYISAIDYKKAFGEAARDELKGKYKAATGAWDIYILFFELSLKILAERGFVCLINPNKYLAAPYAEGLREHLLANASIVELVDVSRIRAFRQVSVYPVISLFQRDAKRQSNIRVLSPIHQREQDFDIRNFREKFVPPRYLQLLPERIWGFLLSEHYRLLDDILKQSRPLFECGEVNATSTASEADDYGQYFIDEPKARWRLINTGIIERYESLWGRERLTHQGKKLLHPVLPETAPVSANRRKLYNAPKIIFAKMASVCEAFPDLVGEYASVNTNCFYAPRNNEPLQFFAAIFNSKAFMFVYELYFGALRMAGGDFQWGSPQLRLTPIPAASHEQQMQISTLVEWIVWLHQQASTMESKQQNPRDPLFASHFEQYVNALVYELYFPAELHAAALHFFRLVEQAELPALNSIPESKRLTKLRALGEQFNDTKHPLYAALYTLRGLEIVRIIEGEP